MELTNADVYVAKDSLDKLDDVRLPVKTSLAVARLANQVAREFQVMEKVRVGLIKQYGVDVEGKKGEISIEGAPEENKEKFFKEWGELMDAKNTTLKVEGKITLSQTTTVNCVHCKHATETPLEIEPAILRALDPFIEVA